MELYLEVSIQILDAINSGISSDKYENPEELIYCFCEAGLQFTNQGPIYYHVENCKSVFRYLDRIEQSIPKEDKTMSWDWGGVRQGTKYYIFVHFIRTTDTKYNIEKTLDTVFEHQLTVTGEFEIPGIERDYGDDKDERHEGKYDDDSNLRIVEECTFGRKWVEWDRPYPEKEGSGLSTLFGIVSFVSGIITIIACLDQIKIKLREKYYSWIIARLTRIVRKKTGNTGEIISPKPMPPRCYDGKTGRKEYLFYQIRDDGCERKIFISMNGKYIKKMPYK